MTTPDTPEPTCATCGHGGWHHFARESDGKEFCRACIMDRRDGEEAHPFVPAEPIEGRRYVITGLRCLLGFHRWREFGRPYLIGWTRACERCSRNEEASYDMANGGTLWTRFDDSERPSAEAVCATCGYPWGRTVDSEGDDMVHDPLNGHQFVSIQPTEPSAPAAPSASQPEEAVPGVAEAAFGAWSDDAHADILANDVTLADVFEAGWAAAVRAEPSREKSND